MSQRGVIPIPMARPVGVPMARVAIPRTPTNPPIGQAANPLGGNSAVRYGRLTNPDLLVVAGDWARVQSEFLWALKFVPYAEDADAPVRSKDQQVGDLYIEFVNGFIGNFQGRSYSDYRDYLKAFSKGKFHRRTPWYSNYVTVRPQLYFGAALTARIRANG